jgi:2'-5' RNA ligase
VQLNPSLRELNAFISENLRQRGFDIECRKYTPHITLGREVVMSPGFNKAEFERTLPRLTVPVSRISLMKSERVHGAIRYVEIYAKELQ